MVGFDRDAFEVDGGRPRHRRRRPISPRCAGAVAVAERAPRRAARRRASAGRDRRRARPRPRPRRPWRRVIDINLTGTFLTVKAAMPALRRAGGGSIVTVSSAAGITAWYDQAAYDAVEGRLREPHAQRGARLRGRGHPRRTASCRPSCGRRCPTASAPSRRQQDHGDVGSDPARPLQHAGEIAARRALPRIRRVVVRDREHARPRRRVPGPMTFALIGRAPDGQLGIAVSLAGARRRRAAARASLPGAWRSVLPGLRQPAPGRRRARACRDRRGSRGRRRRRARRRSGARVAPARRPRARRPGGHPHRRRHRPVGRPPRGAPTAPPRATCWPGPA